MSNLAIKSYRVKALLTALILSLAACTPTPDTAQEYEAKVKVDERMATDITPSNSFTTNSYDDIQIGADYDPQLLTKNTDDLGGCFGAQSAAHPDADYMIIDSKVVEIGTWSENIASAYGVKVSDNLEQLYAKHRGQQPEVTDSPYGNPDENIIIYYWHDQSANNGNGEQRVGTKYQVDNEVVTSISIGLESALRLWEGCS